VIDSKRATYAGGRPGAVEEKGAAGFARERLGLDLDTAQEAALESTSKQVLLNCTRQWGKSTVTAAKALYTAVSQKGSLVLVVSPSGRQSGEFIRKVKTMVQRLGEKVRGDGNNRWSVALKSGSRIVGLPASEATVRGFSSAALVVVDEAARVRDEMYEAVSPALAVTEGEMWLLSTPKGKRGYFYRMWEHGGKDWERVRVTGPECGRIQPRFLEREKARMGEAKFRAEYLCEFNEDGDAVFREEDIANMWDESVKELQL